MTNVQSRNLFGANKYSHEDDPMIKLRPLVTFKSFISCYSFISCLIHLFPYSGNDQADIEWPDLQNIISSKLVDLNTNGNMWDNLRTQLNEGLVVFTSSKPAIISVYIWTMDQM